MPLDTSSYSLALLRVDGRRWNELRRVHAQISTQAASDGSSYMEMGNTKLVCTVSGPAEARRAAGAAGADAQIEVEINVAGFSGLERKKRARNDKRLAEMRNTIASALESLVLTHLFPHSQIVITIHVLSQDGSLLAGCINASTLALIDAGVPMTDYLVACTAGSTAGFHAGDANADPLLDLNAQEELDLPFLTVATHGASEDVSVLVMETRVQLERIESMLAVGLDGCKQVKRLLDQIVRDHGTTMLSKMA